ncbi:YceI family protein [Reyranella sp.]|uniref:YceI family protein n=1 Tax=Reyranella sp. TaxID=1929291 RepID=UPI003784BDD7
MSQRRDVRASLLSSRVLATFLALVLVPAIGHGQAAPSDLPPGVYPAEQDYKLALAGTYALDPDHAAVIARVSHLGYSYSIFRFDRLDATLTWDPADPSGAALSAKVEAASIASNVKGFSEQLAGDNFLKSNAFPQVTFASTAFRQTGPRAGKVDGTLSLLGHTKPVTFDVELVGAGKGLTGQPRIGATARASINPVEFGLMPLLGPSIEIVADVEFVRTP